ncbi:MAG: hypothetical protein AAFQ80_17600 [Cyanobacteria bacterium J06621_8]
MNKYSLTIESLLRVSDHSQNLGGARSLAHYDERRPICLVASYGNLVIFHHPPALPLVGLVKLTILVYAIAEFCRSRRKTVSRRYAL